MSESKSKPSSSFEHINFEEDGYTFLVKFNDEYAPSSFSLLIRSEGLVIMDEDALNFWFIDRNLESLLAFVESREEYLEVDHRSFWVQKDGEEVDLKNILEVL